MQSVFDILSDPSAQPGRLFVYGGYDALASKHLLSDVPPEDPWSDRFPVGRSMIMVLPPARTGRVRFEMWNMDTGDSDVWAGQSNALRCLVDPSAYRPRPEMQQSQILAPSSKGQAAGVHRQPKTHFLGMMAALASTPKQKDFISGLIRLEGQLYMRHVAGFQLAGQIDRLSVANPIIASMMQTEITLRFPKRGIPAG